jgi:hypothetical protein
MQGKMGMKNCFGIMSKVSFITAPFWSNLHCFYRICKIASCLLKLLEAFWQLSKPFNFTQSTKSETALAQLMKATFKNTQYSCENTVLLCMVHSEGKYQYQLRCVQCYCSLQWSCCSGSKSTPGFLHQRRTIGNNIMPTFASATSNRSNILLLTHW